MQADPQPLINHIYIRAGFTGPFPRFEESCEGWQGELISGSGSKPIVRISPELVVKFGSHVNTNEAESLLFVEKHASGIPAPRLYASYTIGSYDRDVDDYGSLYDTYIVMSFVDGIPLDHAWMTLDGAQKTSIGMQLRDHIKDLRSVMPDQEMEFCSIMGGGLGDYIFETHTTQGNHDQDLVMRMLLLTVPTGPFRTEHDLNDALATIQDNSNRKAHLRCLTAGALAQLQHKASLTHGDLQGRNILVVGDIVTGIVDWE